MRASPAVNKLFPIKSTSSLKYLVVILPLLLFSGVMVMKVIPYLGFGRTTNFLSTKTDSTLDNNFFRFGFYVHITSSMIVLVAGLFQFFPAIVKYFPKLHRSIGKTYVAIILFLAAPSGLILASFANGGLPSKTGFTLQCIVWWCVTMLAYTKIRQRHFKEHVQWMIRSYAVTLAAMSLRTEGYAMHYFFNTQPIETYITITWLSWVGNLILAEALIVFGLNKFLLKQIFQTTTK